MDNIIHSLVDLDMSSRLIIMKIAVQGAIDEGVINEHEEEAIVKTWITELNLLDRIKESIEAQGLLNQEQKDYLWSIVLKGV